MFNALREFYKEEPVFFIMVMFFLVTMALFLFVLTNGKALVFFGVVGAIVYGIVWLVNQGEREDL